MGYYSHHASLLFINHSKETLIYSEFPRYRDVPPFSMIVNH